MPIAAHQWSPTGTPVHTVSPDGTLFDSTTHLNPSTACVVWAWSTSNDAWLRQSDFVPYSQAGRQLAELMADCPTVRPVLTPARPGVGPLNEAGLR